MLDRRIVKLLVRNRDGKFLTLERFDSTSPASQRELVGGDTLPGENDVVVLDRILRDDLNIFLQTQDAIEIGYDSEYEPGEGVVTRVLYMLKIPSTHLNIILSEKYRQYEWSDVAAMRGFEPPFQVLVQTALDFYLPAEL